MPSATPPPERTDPEALRALPGDPSALAACRWPKHEEEALAARHSRITRIAGWLLVAVPILSVVGAFFGRPGHIDLLSLIAGIMVLKGSQAWLRFASCIYLLVGIGGWWTVLPAIVHGRPIEIEDRGDWVARDQPEFWTEHVAVIGALTFIGLASFLALKGRRLVFLTPKVRAWGGAMAAIALIAAGVELHQQFDERRQTRRAAARFERELDAIRHELSAGPRTSTFLTPATEQLLRQRPEIEVVVWETLPRGAMTVLYHRDNSYSFNFDEVAFSAFHRLPSGEHGRIRFVLGQPP